MTSSEIVKEIELVWDNFLKVRSHFPFIRKDDIGKRIISSSPYYSNKGHQVSYDFGKELDENDVIQSNKVSNWLNQNGLIRLYSLMNYRHFVGEKISINQKVEGWIELDLLRRLRIRFSHTDGRYNPKNKEHQDLMKDLIEEFKLDNRVYDHFPISIETVIEPIFKGCKLYVVNSRG